MTQTPPLGSSKSASHGAPDASTKSVRPPRGSRLLVWVGLALAVVALAYGVGRMQGAQALSNAEQRHATEIETVRSHLGACEIDRSLLTARRSLSLVALSLDRRNFGVAENHRREASEALEQPRLSGLAEVANLSKTVRGLNLGVDPDPGAKRERVIAASEALDAVLTSRARAVVPTPAGSGAKISH